MARARAIVFGRPLSSVPEYVARSWWERLLYNQAAKRVKSMLLGRPHTVVVNVPYRREDPALFESALGAMRATERDQPPGNGADEDLTRKSD